eukprot:g4070.t1
MSDWNDIVKTKKPEFIVVFPRVETLQCQEVVRQFGLLQRQSAAIRYLGVHCDNSPELCKKLLGHDPSEPKILFFDGYKVSQYEGSNFLQWWSNKKNQLPREAESQVYFRQLPASIKEISYLTPGKPGNWPVYVLNPDRLVERWQAMRGKIPKATRVTCAPFEESDSKKVRDKKVAAGHIKMWKRALNDMKQYKDEDGAVFLEDDMVLMKNWRGWLSRILQNRDIDVLRFDPFPYTHFRNVTGLSVHRPTVPFCTGGYYISYEILEKVVASVDYWIRESGIEAFFDQYIYRISPRVKTTTPRLGIQDWYKDRAQSNIQPESDFFHNRDMQRRYYLPKYGAWYDL